MARFGDFDQYLDNAGDPLVEGKLYFYESGTTTPKTTFADINNSIPNTNPVLLSAAGRQPNIFFEGVAKVILTDNNDVQIAVRDPVGETGTDFGDEWVATKIYSAQDVVLGSDGVYYRSLSNGNQNNNPVTSSGFWTLLYSVEWNAGITYQVGAVVTYDGEQYQSLQSSNLNQNPSTASSYWVLLSFAWLATATYAEDQNAVGTDGILYTSLQDGNIGNDPATSPAYWVGTSAAAAASAVAAAASATAASASETAAAASETAAAASETAAAASESAAATSETNAATSASAASTSATNAATSETNAAASETAAAASETAAAASESAAATSETNAASSASAASTSETNAAASETAAAASETAAAASETAAATSETNAASSASAASTSETNAAASATAAASSATAAAGSATAASGSATAAASSATDAATSETNAADSETAAATSETNASASEAAAAASETAAATSETNAATSASNASTSETNAATSETNAASSASAASTSASNASSSATAASGSASAAATSASDAASIYDDFDDRYLGDKASDPTLDNDGNALLTGALYFNTTDDKMKVYTGSAWTDVAPVATSITVSQISDYTGTATELNYTDGVTSPIQTQLDAKPDDLSDLGITATATELNYTDGVTSSIQTQLDGKETADATILKDADINSTVLGYVAPSTSGNVLTSNGSSWQSTAPAGGGSWTLISTTNITSTVSSIDITSGIDSTYDNYVVVFNNLRVQQSSNTMDINLYLNGTLQGSSNYRYMRVRGTSVNNENNRTAIFTCDSGGGYINGTFHILNANNAFGANAVGYHGAFQGADDRALISGSINRTGNVTGIFVSNLGSIYEGTVRLYGIKN